MILSLPASAAFAEYDLSPDRECASSAGMIGLVMCEGRMEARLEDDEKRLYDKIYPALSTADQATFKQDQESWDKSSTDKCTAAGNAVSAAHTALVLAKCRIAESKDRIKYMQGLNICNGKKVSCTDY